MKSSDIDQKELDNKLQTIADDNECLVMSFIASSKVVRTSPASYDYTSITIEDLYTIEDEIQDLKKKGADLPKKLKIVVHTPGGQVHAVTKIVKYLQSLFPSIEAVVPYEASSGGTVLCLAAERIVLDEIANLTPIDPQVPYKDIRISAISYEQAIEDFQDMWGKYQPHEIPSPYQQMGEDFDPVIKKQMEKIAYDAMLLAFELMNRAQNPKGEGKKRTEVIRTALNLVRTSFPHGHIINRKEALDIGLPVAENTESVLDEMQVYKKWVKVNMEEDKVTHIIKCFCPTNKKTNGKKTTKKKS